MANPLSIPIGLEKREDGRWYKNCPYCGKEQSYLRRNYAINSCVLNLRCHACSKGVLNPTAKFVRGVRVSWYTRFEKNAVTRGIDWHINIDDVADLYEKQNGKCALTGWSIKFAATGHPNNENASIDRIDNNKGYTKENIQLVCGMVNMMKGKYSMKDFTAVCKAVACNYNW